MAVIKFHVVIDINQHKERGKAPLGALNMDYSFEQLYRTEESEIEKYTSMDSVIRLQRAIETAKKEIAIMESKLYNQVQLLQTMQTTRQILITRRAERWGKGKVEITVRVNEIKTLDSGYSYTDHIYKTYQKFNGNQKKDAIAYAQELKKKYNCEIVKENWK